MAGAIIGALIIAGATTGTAAYQAGQEKKQQKKLLEYQEEKVRKAEFAVAGAERIAGDKARETVRKRRLAQTQTILTSPLGVEEIVGVGKKLLFGD